MPSPDIATLPKQSPWGAIDHSTELKPGIWSVSTPSHGGFWLAPDRLRELRKAFDFTPFAGGPWFEEDQDVAAVIIAFEADFTDEEIFFAVEMVDRCCEPGSRFFVVWKHLQDTQAGSYTRRRANRFRESVETKWRRGGSSSMTHADAPQGHTCVFFSRGDSRRQVIMPYPEQNWHTDDELNAIEWKPPESLCPRCGADLIDENGDPAVHADVDIAQLTCANGCSHGDIVTLLIGNLTEPAPVRFNEADCGGVFDGNRVISDAEPGL